MGLGTHLGTGARRPAVDVIHHPWTMTPMEQHAAGVVIGRDHPAPIVDLADARARALAAFKAHRTARHWVSRTATSTPSAATMSTAAAATAASHASPGTPHRRVAERLRPPLDVAREHDRGPELAQGPCPCEHQPGTDGGSGERDRDVADHRTRARPVHGGRLLQLARHARQPGARGADEERCRHERLRDDDRDGGERDRHAGHLQRPTQETAPTVHEQQRQARHRWWQHDGQVHERLGQRLAPDPRRARIHARGEPKTTTSTTAIVDVQRLSVSAASRESVGVPPMAPAVSARPMSARTGRPRNRSAMPASVPIVARADRPPSATRTRSSSVAPAAVMPPR